MDKEYADILIRKIEEKIKELEEQENPIDLLKQAIFKKNIITNINDITDEEIEELFVLIEKHLKK